MNTSQTIITLGALTLLTVVILNFNRVFSSTEMTMDQNRYRLEALSILSSYIEQTSQYFFDEASTDTTVAKTLSNFTDPQNLGPDPNDNGIVDDFDDFHNQTRLDTGLTGIVYKLMFKVEYVKLLGKNLIVDGNKHYNKRMTIEITDNYPEPLLRKYVNGEPERDTLRISFIKSYWFYD
ncbi:MAG: hypothetical protein Kow0037_17180 [Calditrichia bacterium]